MRFFSNTTLENEVCRPKSGINLYPGGMQMSGRTWNGTADRYRYSHNSHEREDAIFEGAQSAEYWMYDSRIGRRWERDPVVKEWESPYATFANNPIYYSDPLGLVATEGDDVIATDTKTGEVYTQKDINGENFVEHVEGTWNEDHSKFTVSETTHYTYTTEQDGATANIDNSTRAGQDNFSFHNTNYTPNAYQKGVYKSMDQAQKATAVTLIAPFVMEAFPAQSYWLLTTAGEVALEEAAGMPNPRNGAVKQVAKNFEQGLADKGIKGTLDYAKKRMTDRGFTKDAVLKIVNEGAIKETVHRGSTQLHYKLGKYTVAVETAGANKGMIVNVMGDVTEKGANGVAGPFTGF